MCLFYTEIMEIFALGFIFFLPIFFTSIYRLVQNLTLWQSKEYRFERILSHIIWDIDHNSKTFYVLCIKFIIFSLILTFTSSLTISAIAIIAIYTIWIFELFEYLYNIFHYRTFGINSSIRNLSILGIYSIILTTIFFTISVAFTVFPRVESSTINLGNYITANNEGIAVFPDSIILLIIFSVIGLTLDIATPFITAMLVFFTSPLGRLRKLFNIYNLKRKLKLIPNVKIVGITGSFGKSTLIKYIDELTDKKQIVIINMDYTSVSALSAEISKLITKETKVIIFEFEGYVSGEIKEIIQILKPNLIALTDIGFNHVSGFESHEDLINSFREIETPYTTIISTTNNQFNFDVIRDIDSMKLIEIGLTKSKTEFHFGERIIESISLMDQKYKRYALEIFSQVNLLSEAVLKKISKTPVNITNTEEILGDLESILILDTNENSDINGLINLISTKTATNDSNLKVLITDGFTELGRLKTKIFDDFVVEISKHVDFIVTTDHALHSAATRNNIISHYFSDINKLLIFIRKILTKNLILYIEGKIKAPLVSSLRKQD